MNRKILAVSMAVLSASTCVLAAEEVVISHTRVALGIRSGGFQCNTTPSVQHNPSLIQANYCSLNTLTYTWSGRRVGMFEFNLSAIPEGAQVLDAYVRLQGMCCYGETEYMELIAMPGAGYFNSGQAAAVFSATGDVVVHPPTIPDPGYGEYTIDSTLMESVRTGNNWLLIGIDHQGWFTNIAPEATLHVTYEPPLPCDADIDGNGTVDASDLGILLAYWGPKPAGGDFNGDGYANAADLGILLASWGPCP
ncbi:MAG: hypothetical protein MK085_10295 [Phycisphaerales bacterium]|nr:hypothetical protein [Phycisphaerales bacterium]